MALWKITVNKKFWANGEHAEKGMSIEVSYSSMNPVSTADGKQLVQAAFQRIYGLDAKKCGVLSTSYLDCEKIG